MNKTGPSEQARALARQASAKSTGQLIQDARLDVNREALGKIEQRASQMPQTFVRVYLKAMRGKSVAAAIRAFCAECCGWDRASVTNCTAPACALYPYRPFQD